MATNTAIDPFPIEAAANIPKPEDPNQVRVLKRECPTSPGLYFNFYLILVALLNKILIKIEH